jgi:hypothetical protein
MKFSCLLARVCSVENWLIFGLIAGVRPADIIELSLCSPVNCCTPARNSSGVTGTRRSPPSRHRLNLWSGPAQDALRTIPILAVAYDVPWQQACPHNLLPLDHFMERFSRQFYSSTLKTEHKLNTIGLARYKRRQLRDLSSAWADVRRSELVATLSSISETAAPTSDLVGSPRYREEDRGM